MGWAIQLNILLSYYIYNKIVIITRLANTIILLLLIILIIKNK